MMKCGKYLLSDLSKIVPEVYLSDSLAAVKKRLGVDPRRGRYKVFSVRDGKIIEITLSGKAR
jgi:hypothetical protein